MDDPLTLKVPNPETGDRQPTSGRSWPCSRSSPVMVVFAAHLAGLGLGVTGVLGGVVLGLVLLVTLAYFAPAPLTLRRVGPRIEGPRRPGPCPPAPAGWWCAATRT